MQCKWSQSEWTKQLVVCVLQDQTEVQNNSAPNACRDITPSTDGFFHCVMLHVPLACSHPTDLYIWEFTHTYTISRTLRLSCWFSLCVIITLLEVKKQLCCLCSYSVIQNCFCPIRGEVFFVFVLFSEYMWSPGEWWGLVLSLRWAEIHHVLAPFSFALLVSHWTQCYMAEIERRFP